jgi:hypothetical protein
MDDLAIPWSVRAAHSLPGQSAALSSAAQGAIAPTGEGSVRDGLAILRCTRRRRFSIVGEAARAK